MQPSPEEKQAFLEFIRSGDDRSTAAYRTNPEYTGRIYRAMCNPHSKMHYDPEFAVAYDEAVADRGPLDPNREMPFEVERRPPSTTTPNGYTKAMYLTESQIAQFLDFVQDGDKPASAARKVEPATSITQIHRRANRDLAFAEKFREAMSSGYPAYQEMLRAESARQAFAGDYKALRDQMIMHLPEAREALTTSRHEVGGLDGGAIRELAEKHFADLPPEMVEEMIRALEEKELGGTREIGSGDDS
jgi:hypothetical protein